MRWNAPESPRQGVEEETVLGIACCDGAKNEKHNSDGEEGELDEEGLRSDSDEDPEGD